jgi:hypothetical protein
MEQVHLTIHDEPLSFGNLIDQTVTLMLHVQNMHTLSGVQKKALVIKSLMKVAQDLPDETNGPGLLEDIIVRFIPTMIDLLIVVDKGHIRINNKMAGCFSCFVS